VSAVRFALSRLSPAGPRARLSILIFHRVLPRPDPLYPDEPDAARFDALCAWLRTWFNVLPLDEAVRRLGEGALPERAAAITFDDGYADNRTVAMPILQRHGLSATFFVATDFLDGGIMWNDVVAEGLRGAAAGPLDLSPLGHGLGPVELGDAASRRAAIDGVVRAVKHLPPRQRAEAVAGVARLARLQPPTDLMMSSAQVRELRAGGMLVGAHTGSHPILATLPREAAHDEVRRSKSVLEALLDERVALFAYPNGKPGTDYGPEAVDVVRGLGFDAAVSTCWGAADAQADRFQLPRFTPWDRTPLRFAGRMARNLMAAARP
jgi:peptidoglycan/xylan/chitin deacetylase (PgdA/CDA1 family)